MNVLEEQGGFSRALRSLGHPGAVFARSRQHADVDGRCVPVRAVHDLLLTAGVCVVSHAASPNILRLTAVSKFVMDEFKDEVWGPSLNEHILQSEPGPSCLLRLVDG
jgi:hypothetical protein